MGLARLTIRSYSLRNIQGIRLLILIMHSSALVLQQGWVGAAKAKNEGDVEQAQQRRELPQMVCICRCYLFPIVPLPNAPPTHETAAETPSPQPHSYQLPRYILHLTQHSVSDNRICRERPSASPVSESTTFLRAQYPSRRLRVALLPHAGNPHTSDTPPTETEASREKETRRAKQHPFLCPVTVEPDVDVAADPTANVYSSSTCG